MKIIFFSHDESIEELAESIHNYEWAFCAGIDELVFELEQASEEDRICLCLDFDSGLKEIDKFLKKVVKAQNLIKIGLSSRDNLKIVRKHQKSKLSCHQYLMKPLELKGLTSAINDHLLSVYIEENQLTEEGDEVSGAPSIQILAQPHKALYSLDEDKEDYDTTKSRIVIPDGFRTDGRSVIEGANSIEDEINDDEEPEEAFTAQEFRMDDEVQSLIDKHRKGSSGLSFGEDPINDKIQAKFDAVFKTDSFGKDETDLFSSEPGQTGSISFGEEESLMEDDSPSISFDLGEEEPAEDKKNPNQDPVEDMTKKTGTNEGLEFNLDDDAELLMGSDDDTSESKASESTDDEEGGLDFSFGDEGDDEDLLENNSSKKSADEDGDGLNFDTDDSLLETSSKPNKTADEVDSGFDFDLDGEIETSTKPKASKGPEDIKDEDSDFLAKTNTKTLDDVENEDDGLSFSMTEDSSAESKSDDEDFSELSFDENTDDENMEATKVASIDTSSFNRGEETTNDHLERTISEIVQGPTRSSSIDLSDEDKTGDFDLAALVDEGEEDEDFSFDAVDQGDEGDEGSDKTAQTVIATGSLSSLQAMNDSQSEAKEKGTQTEDLAAELFDEAEDLFSVESDGGGAHPLEQEIADDKTEVGFSLSDPGISSPVSHTPASEPRAEVQSRSMNSIGEDELLRLQSTIRHLREEREESLIIINNLKKEVKLIEQDGLGTKAELDEAKIEISILKKRHLQEVEELRYQLKLSDEKKQIYEERCKNYQKEFDRLNHKVRIEFNQVKQREKELESQLELVSMDSESQVKSRDTKILELKRKIDALEFNMENVTIREQKTKEDKVKIEERMNKIMSTLRGSIKLLEEDIDLTEDLKSSVAGQTRNREDK